MRAVVQKSNRVSREIFRECITLECVTSPRRVCRTHIVYTRGVVKSARFPTDLGVSLALAHIGDCRRSRHRPARTCPFVTLFASHVTPDTYSRVNQPAYVSRMRSRLVPARLGSARNKIGRARAYAPVAENPTTR